MGDIIQPGTAPFWVALMVVAGLGLIELVSVLIGASASGLLDDGLGHHALDAGAVLGSVQGSPLRFDRAPARPSGLDAASAQLRHWQLRDGPMRRPPRSHSGAFAHSPPVGESLNRIVS